ncbi:unnamed protein product [Sphenostylis stenocarpa]|uniref:HMA domain-containing protein n=1 Tax=Sphenostylis stenocarpa TaxID=92480 RepID=A0AA86T8E3_9FABA|nr:unnamed protein product [Sphenostylis stenocarpa]
MEKQAKKCDHGHINNKETKNDKTSSSNSTTIVLKIDMHCDECASKIIKCLRGSDDNSYAEGV